MDIEPPLAPRRTLLHKIALNVFLYICAMMAVYLLLAMAREFVAFILYVLTWVIPSARLRNAIAQDFFHWLWLSDTAGSKVDIGEAEVINEWMPMFRTLWAIFCAHAIWAFVNMILGIIALNRDRGQRMDLNVADEAPELVRGEVGEEQVEGGDDG